MSLQAHMLQLAVIKSHGLPGLRQPEIRLSFEHPSAWVKEQFCTSQDLRCHGYLLADNYRLAFFP